MSTYPESPALRDKWILAQRGARNSVDPWRPYAAILERERAASGEVVPVGTIFLTNKECPWRCVMCDLWKNTLTERVPLGAIPRQIESGLEQIGPTARQIKLYNSGSFFDPQAIPPEEFPAITVLVKHLENVIVENHPALVGPAIVKFAEMLAGKLEVAMGLETAHPEALAKLNKRMTLEQFARAADFVTKHGIAVRAFILVQPPFIQLAEAVEWATKSVDFAFDCGASVVSLIPVRLGNGALEALDFLPPRLETVEVAFDYAVQLQRGRAFVDLWGLERFSNCSRCFPQRHTRLESMNFEQRVLPSVGCDACGL